jgi:hypothetical protein
MYDAQHLLKLSEKYHQNCLQELVKTAFVRKMPNGKWRVVSRKGKSLGTYDTKEEAVKRLRQIEFFKHHDQNNSDATKIDQKIIDLTDIDDFSYSAIMRKLRQKASKEQIKEFLKLFKTSFDKAVKNKLQKPEKVALQNSLIRFNKLHPIKLNKKLVKMATVSELGAPVQVGQYLANIIRFILNRLEPDKRTTAMEALRNKFYSMNADEIAQKTSPPSAGVGQAITFVKHVLFNQNTQYIREVLNNVSRNLY